MPAVKSTDRPLAAKSIKKSEDFKSSLIDDDTTNFHGTNVLSQNEIPLSNLQEKAIKGK